MLQNMCVNLFVQRSVCRDSCCRAPGADSESSRLPSQPSGRPPGPEV